MTGGLSKLFPYITRNAEPIVKLRDEADNTCAIIRNTKNTFQRAGRFANRFSAGSVFRNAYSGSYACNPSPKTLINMHLRIKKTAGHSESALFCEWKTPEKNLTITEIWSAYLQIEELSEKLVSPGRNVRIG